MLLSSTYAGVQVDIVRGERRHGSPARRMVLVRICVRCRPPHDYCTGVAGCWAQPPRHRRGFPCRLQRLRITRSPDSWRPLAPLARPLSDRDSKEVRNEMDHLPVYKVLHPDEEIQVEAPAGEHVIVVTSRRLAIGSQERLALDVPIDNLRRIQFDIERARPATLVIVPNDPTDEPQVLSVRPEDYRGVADALVVIGQRLADVS